MKIWVKGQVGSWICDRLRDQGWVNFLQIIADPCLREWYTVDARFSSIENLRTALRNAGAYESWVSHKFGSGEQWTWPIKHYGTPMQLMPLGQFFGSHRYEVVPHQNTDGTWTIRYQGPEPNPDFWKHNPSVWWWGTYGLWWHLCKC